MKLYLQRRNLKPTALPLIINKIATLLFLLPTVNQTITNFAGVNGKK